MTDRHMIGAVYGTTGGTIAGVNKTTIYLPDDLRDAVKRMASTRGVAEAEVIRDAIRTHVATERPRPRAGLYGSGHPIAHRVDELLKGFGER